MLRNMRRITWTRPAVRAAVIALGAGLLLAACGSGSGSSAATSAPATSAAASSPASATSSPAPGSSAALCADAAALRSSISSLTHIKVGKGSANQIKSGVADVQAKLAAFTAQAKGQWQAETTALKSALAKLQTAASNLASHPSLSTVPGVVTAVGGVTTAAGSLWAAVGTTCPSGSPSPST
jgi:hypothetical protein